MNELQFYLVEIEVVILGLVEVLYENFIQSCLDRGCRFGIVKIQCEGVTDFGFVEAQRK